MSAAGGLFKRVLGFVVHGGSWRLQSYETQLLEAVCQHISASDASALKAQLAQLDHVKRLHADRMVTFYFQNAERLPRLADESEGLCVARFKLASASAATTAGVFTHRGLLSSIEFTKSPTPLADSGDLNLKPVRGRAAPAITDEIDREEHG